MRLNLPNEHSSWVIASLCDMEAGHACSEDKRQVSKHGAAFSPSSNITNALEVEVGYRGPIMAVRTNVLTLRQTTLATAALATLPL